MTYILTISYHNLQIAELAYKQLLATTKIDPPRVFLLDNNYPLIKKSIYSVDNPVYKMAQKFGFRYFNTGENLGLHEGYNYLMRFLPKECTSFIVYDGDSYPITDNWHLALLDVHKDPSVAWSSLHNTSSFAELDERGYKADIIHGYNVRQVTKPVINSICAFKRKWLKRTCGLHEPRKLYGGLEIDMFNRMDEKRERWVFLEDYSETRINNIDQIQDQIYKEFKWAYAHEGLEMNFEEYIKMKKNGS